MPRSPLVVFGAMVGLSLLSVACVLFLALRQPWLGLSFIPASEGEGLIVAAVHPLGPGATVPERTRITAIGSEEATSDRVALRAIDRMEEPDGLASVREMDAFFRHQGQIATHLRSKTVLLWAEGQSEPLRLSPAPWRPLSDIPPIFWLQILTGVVGLWVGAWVFALRQGETAPALLAGTGTGLALSAHAAALYSTRELALPETLFAWASATNSMGALVFGACMVSLFLIHPTRIVPYWVMRGALWLMLAWAALAFLRVPLSSAALIHLPVLVEMTLIILAGLAQWIASRGKPQERAALRWFGLSVIIGAGSFVFLIVAPQIMGVAPTIAQGHAFAMFMLVYVGVALGVARYRLFQLEDWAFKLMFYSGGVVVLLGIDIALISIVALDRLPAFSIALLAVAFCYLPAREQIARLLMGGPRLSQDQLFDLITDVGLAATAPEQRRRLHLLMQSVFNPIEISDCASDVPQGQIGHGGETMDLPGLGLVPPLRLRWAHRGRRLFSPGDLRQALTLLNMVQQILDRRRAYEAGVEEERRRINRDIHDNIGIQLLGALHSSVLPRKDVLIRQALTDLREIISNSEGDAPALPVLVADLRSEITEHLVAAEIAVTWDLPDLPDFPLAPSAVIALRAILREAAGNIIRHSGARHAVIRLSVRGDSVGALPPQVHISVTDDGTGAMPKAGDAGGPREGHGLGNLRQRAEMQGGHLHFGPGPGGAGSQLVAEFPLQRALRRHHSLATTATAREGQATLLPLLHRESEI